MPGVRPYRSPTELALTCLPAPDYFLRPQLLTRISAFLRARFSRPLPAPIDRSWSTLEDVRLRAGSLTQNVSHYQGIRAYLPDKQWFGLRFADHAGIV